MRVTARVRAFLEAAVFVAALVFPAPRVHALPLSVGGRVGLNLARLAFDDLPAGIESDFRAGFVAAGHVAIPVLPMLAVEVGVDVATQGTELDGTLQFGSTSLEAGRIKLTYLHLPVLAKLSMSVGPTRPYVKFGPQMGLLLTAKAEAESSSFSGGVVETDIKDSAAAVDFALQFAGGLEFPVATVRGFVEIGYGLGLVHVFDAPDLPDSWNAKNQVLGITLGLSY